MFLRRCAVRSCLQFASSSSSSNRARLTSAGASGAGSAPPPQPPSPSPQPLAILTTGSGGSGDITPETMALIIGLVVGILALVVVAVLLYFLWESRQDGRWQMRRGAPSADPAGRAPEKPTPQMGERPASGDGHGGHNATLHWTERPVCYQAACMHGASASGLHGLVECCVYVWGGGG